MKENLDDYYRFYSCTPIKNDPCSLIWQCKRILSTQKDEIPQYGKVVALFSIFPEKYDIERLPKRLSTEYVTIIEK
jgi:hypothetical protein